VVSDIRSELQIAQIDIYVVRLRNGITDEHGKKFVFIRGIRG